MNTVIPSSTFGAEIPLPDFNNPEEMKAAFAKLLFEKNVLAQKDALRKEELSFKAMIDAEPRFIPFRNNLLIRRISNADEIAPARDVFDLIQLSDMKRKAYPEIKRTYVSDREFKTYQEMKAEGIANIEFKDVLGRMKNNIPEASDADDEGSNNV